MPNTGTIRSFIMGASNSRSDEKQKRDPSKGKRSSGSGRGRALSDGCDGDGYYSSDVEIPVKELTAKSGQPFKVLNIDVKIDKKPTHIDEGSNTVLKYKTPHFRASATVQVPPLRKGEQWQIGWIQACTFMKFVNTYGNEGCSSWEFPEITSGQHNMISDSDGRHYPWYGNKGVVAAVEGPSKIYQTICVGMTDNFYPHITWVIPIEGEKKPKLTHIIRNQTFLTWLVARDMIRDTYHILKTTTWTFWLEISVSPEKPLGQRAQLVGPWEQKAPLILEENIPIEHNAMRPPNANSAQILVWRPARGHAKIIIPPKWRHSHDRDRRCSSPSRKSNRKPRASSSAAGHSGRSTSRSPSRHGHSGQGTSSKMSPSKGKIRTNSRAMG